MSKIEIPVWAEADWVEQVTDWLERELGWQGIQITNSLDQFRLRVWSTLIKVPTDRGTLIFKAVTPELAHEAAATQAIATWQPDSSLAVLAAAPQRGWLLMQEGSPLLRDVLKADQNLQHWHAILPRYAQLQITAANHVADLLAMGVPDRRLTVLPQALADLLVKTEVLGIGEAWGLTEAEYEQLTAWKRPLADLCAQLAAYPIPDSIDHGDFHDGNIFAMADGYRFFDWGDCSVTHPFFSLRAAFVSLENTLGLPEDSPLFGPLQDRYLKPWTIYDSQANLVKAFQLAWRLMPLPAALRWYSALSLVEDIGEFAHAIPSLLREFLTLNDDNRFER